MWLIFEEVSKNTAENLHKPVLLAETLQLLNPQADEILCGGFPLNSINVVMGQPGTGKTIFAEQLLYHNAGGDRPIL